MKSLCRVKDICSGLARLGFRTGLMVLGTCVIFYVLSFVQMALPIVISGASGYYNRTKMDWFQLQLQYEIYNLRL